MILNIDTSGKEFQVTKRTEPKRDQNGDQRVNKQNEPMWTTQVVVTDTDGGEVININTHGDQPEVEIGDLVDITGLTALPWSANGRSGMSFKADRIKVVDD